LELSPSFITHKGSQGLLNEVVSFNVWGINSPFDKTTPLEEHLQWLVSEFSGKHEILRKLMEDNNIDILCSVTLIGEDGFSLSPKSLSLISDLQVNLEFSLITLEDLDEEDLEGGRSE
jgi:hypothetical protein